MTINVVIERLVLEGLPITPGQAPILGEALRTELARLLSEGGLPARIAGGGVVPRLNGGTWAPRQDARADAIGAQLARPIAGALRS